MNSVKTFWHMTSEYYFDRSDPQFVRSAINHRVWVRKFECVLFNVECGIVRICFEDSSV